MKKLLSKKGSSSALIIMVLSMLAVFSVLTMMSTYSNLKLAERSASWMVKYYENDLLAEEIYTYVDGRSREQPGADKYGIILADLENRYPDITVSSTIQQGGMQLFCTVGDTAQQGLVIGLFVPEQIDVPCGITQWTQWQQSVDYEQPQTDLWQGG